MVSGHISYIRMPFRESVLETFHVFDYNFAPARFMFGNGVLNILSEDFNRDLGLLLTQNRLPAVQVPLVQLSDFLIRNHLTSPFTLD